MSTGIEGAKQIFDETTPICKGLRSNVPLIQAMAFREIPTVLKINSEGIKFTPTETYHVRFDRDVVAARWKGPERDVLEFWIEADSFMRQMNRVLVGTMLEVARGIRSVEQFIGLPDGRPRADSGVTAPAHGLYLVDVAYGGRRVLPRRG